MSYILKDHIGSINYILDSTGAIEEEMNFDAWGNRRNATNWSYTNVPNSFMFDRGYTLHEHLDDFKLINMNGRVYDPVVARFLSPDPVLQMPEYSQNFNRYSYVLNNPLKYTDPSGFVIEDGEDEKWKGQSSYSPIKIPDNIFTNGKAAKQLAANEALFGKIKSGFAKDDRVTNNSGVFDNEKNRTDVSIPVAAASLAIENYKSQGYWIGKTTVSKEYRVYNSNRFTGNRFTRNTKAFLKANVALVVINSVFDYKDYRNGVISSNELKFNTGLGVASIWIPEISAGIIIIGGLQLLHDTNEAFWESPTGQKILWNTQRGFEEMGNPENHGAVDLNK